MNTIKDLSLMTEEQADYTAELMGGKDDPKTFSDSQNDASRIIRSTSH